MVDWVYTLDGGETVSRLVIATGVAAGIAVGFEPVWAGRWLDLAFPSWPIPVGVAILVALAAALWRGTRQIDSAKGPTVTMMAVLSIVAGGIVGFGATVVALGYFVVPPMPGHIGDLPGWPWQAVSWELMHRLMPAVVGLGIWVALVCAVETRLTALAPPTARQ